MPRHEDYDWFMDTGGPKMNPQEATEYDSPNPPHKLEDFVSLIVAMINRDRSMGDETEVQDIEQNGLYGLRLKMASGQIFLINVGLEPY